MKRTILALVCAAMMLPAAAQWNPGDNSMSPIHQDKTLTFYSPAMLRTADGNTFLAYESRGKHINPETGTQDDESYFYLHLQKLDKNGNMLFPEGGIIIANKPTKSASYSLVSLDTLSNGNIVLTHADMRDEPADELLHVYVYCYTQDGKPVWSKDGVKMPVYPHSSDYKAPTYYNEKMVVSGDKIYVTAIVVENLQVGHGLINLLEVACLDYSGNVLASRIDTVCAAFNYSLRPAPNGNLYVVYVNDQEGYSARCINANCEDVWSAETVVEKLGVVRHDGTSVYADAPSDVMPLSDGGLALVYYAFPGKSGSELFYNRLYPDGKVLDQHVLLSDTAGLHEGHVCMVDGDTVAVFACQVHDISTDRVEYYLNFNRVLIDGTPLFKPSYGYWQEQTVNMPPQMLGIVKAGGYYQVLTSIIDEYYQTRQSYSYTIGGNGKRVMRKPIIGDVYINDHVFVGNDHYAFFCFTKEDRGADGVWISCADVTDYTHSVQETGALPGKFTVNADGKQVLFSKANLQYYPNLTTFHFASKQWEARAGHNAMISDTGFDWIDLFGWGTGDKGSKSSTSAADYATYTDWGTNTILNSPYDAGTWRAMSDEEWKYILESRPDAANKHAMGQIDLYPYDPVGGIILLPDEFEMPKGIVMDMKATTFTTNSYLPVDWMLLEANGAVFMPLGAYRNGTKVDGVNPDNGRATTGLYWTTTEKGNTEAMMFKIDTQKPAFSAHNRSTGLSVRLVKEAEDQPSSIHETSTANYPSSTQKLFLNGHLYIIHDGKTYDAVGARVK